MPQKEGNVAALNKMTPRQPALPDRVALAPISLGGTVSRGKMMEGLLRSSGGRGSSPGSRRLVLPQNYRPESLTSLSSKNTQKFTTQREHSQDVFLKVHIRSCGIVGLTLATDTCTETSANMKIRLLPSCTFLGTPSLSFILVIMKSLD